MSAAEIAIPQLRATGDIVAVCIETAELAGTTVWVVTVRAGVGRPPYRRWYPDDAQAIAHAGEQADRHALPLIDLREPSFAG